MFRRSCENPSPRFRQGVPGSAEIDDRHIDHYGHGHVESVCVDGPRFAFAVQIRSLIDRVPGGPDVRGLVSTSTAIHVDGQPVESGGDPNTGVFAMNTDWPGSVAVQILVERHTHDLTVTGSIIERQGHWYWVGGNQEIPLAATDPCVTRVWPDGRSMSEHDYATYCTTRIFEPPVPPGIVGTVEFAYDLALSKVAEIHGDVSVVRPFPRPLTRSEEEFVVQRDLSTDGSFTLGFSVKALVARSFATDIRPLFRDSDIEAMKHASGPNSGSGLPAGFDLSSYDTVSAYASQIFPLVSEPGSRTIMPCDWQSAPWARPGWSSGWPEGRIIAFREWMEQGMPP
jgi:hypothetical protein